MSAARLPRLFVAAGTRRGLWALAALTLLSGAAMLPAIATMTDHGASVLAFESAGSVARSQEILAEWGSAGKTRLERAAALAAWLGPLAATSDLLQNLSLALVLSGHINQPWPRISALGGSTTTLLCAAAALFAAVGSLATRRRAVGLTG